MKEHRHQVAHEDDAEQRIAEFRAAAQVGGPIAWVHVTNGDEIAGAGEGENFAEPGGGGRDSDGAMGFRERGSAQAGPR